MNVQVLHYLLITKKMQEPLFLPYLAFGNKRKLFLGVGVR